MKLLDHLTLHFDHCLKRRLSCPSCHVLRRQVPFQGERKEADEYAEYVVRGLAWEGDATKLLVTLREDDQDHYFCLWDLVTATLLECQPW